MALTSTGWLNRFLSPTNAADQALYGGVQQLDQREPVEQPVDQLHQRARQQVRREEPEHRQQRHRHNESDEEPQADRFQARTGRRTGSSIMLKSQ